MTKFLGTVCDSVVRVLSTIFLPVRILLVIVDEIIGFPITMFISKFEIGVKEYFSALFNYGYNWCERLAEYHDRTL